MSAIVEPLWLKIEVALPSAEIACAERVVSVSIRLYGDSVSKKWANFGVAARPTWGSWGPRRPATRKVVDFGTFFCTLGRAKNSRRRKLCRPYRDPANWTWAESELDLIWIWIWAESESGSESGSGSGSEPGSGSKPGPGCGCGSGPKLGSDGI